MPDRIGIAVDLAQREAELEQSVAHDFQPAFHLRMDHAPARPTAPVELRLPPLPRGR